jgi:hypothetical protein
MAPRKLWSQPLAGSQGFARTRKVFGSASLSVVTTDLTLNNVVSLGFVPRGFTVTGINATIPTLDSGAAMTFSIGDSATPARLVANSTVGRSPGGTVSALAAGAAYFKYSTDTEILMTVTAAPTTAVAGAITNFYLEGFIADP